jgi:uncharacterized membrane protein YphA (DoxX/SURF4 family)
MKDYGIAFLRVITGWRLIAGVWGAATNGQQMQEVTGFFQQLGLPIPAASAFVAVYAELICGFLFIGGLWVRPAAIVMAFTFIIAIAMVDIHYSITKSFPAWIILAVSLFLLTNGAGRLSLDAWIYKKNR